MKCYTSKIYKGKYFDAVVTSYYGTSNCPSNFYEVCYRPHTDEENSTAWRSINWVYTSKPSALKRAREIAKG